MVWTCSNCGKNVEKGFDKCWNCGTLREGAAAGDKQESSMSLNVKGYASTYNATRTIASIISLVGWVLVGIGGMVFLKGLLIGGNSSDNPFVSSGALAAYGMLSGLGTSISGLILVLGGQITRAVVDTADNTGRMAFALLRGNMPKSVKNEVNPFEDPAKAEANPNPDGVC